MITTPGGIPWCSPVASRQGFLLLDHHRGPKGCMSPGPKVRYRSLWDSSLLSPTPQGHSDFVGHGAGGGSGGVGSCILTGFFKAVLTREVFGLFFLKVPALPANTVSISFPSGPYNTSYSHKVSGRASEIPPHEVRSPHWVYHCLWRTH